MAQGDWFDGNGSGQPADVAEILEGLGWQGVRELIEAGALVSLGLTSDGGALGFTVTVDGRWRREYFRDRDQLCLWVAEALPAVQEARGIRQPSSGSRRRTKRP